MAGFLTHSEPCRSAAAEEDFAFSGVAHDSSTVPTPKQSYITTQALSVGKELRLCE
jgi:hypothetical protein